MLLTANQKQLEEKINELAQQTKFYMAELKKALHTLPTNKANYVVSYFTSSFNISHALDQESLCLGSYHIWNISNVRLTNPSITIKLPENSPFSFTGRYIYSHLQTNGRRFGSNEWLRIKTDEHKDVFSFKPLDKTIIEPNEILSFDHFQIRWSSNVSYAGSILGFTYCEQFPDGIAVINPINLSAVSLEQEE